MSRKFIKNLKDNELNCYICRKQIDSLAKLRDIYRHKTIEFSYTAKEVKIIRDDVNGDVICAGIKVFRHLGCNPRKYKPCVEDL